MKAFGAFEEAGDQGVEYQPPVTEEQANDDLHAIRERYVVPDCEQATPMNLAVAGGGAGNWFRLDFTTTRFNSIIVSVTQGTLNMYFGDYSGNNLPNAPHVQFPSGLPFQLGFSPKGRVLTFANPSTTTVCIACVTPVNV